MEILRAVKNNSPISINLALQLLNLLEIQVLAIFLINQSLPGYSKILHLFYLDFQLEAMVIFNLAANITEAIYLATMGYKLQRKKSSSQQEKKYVFFDFLEIKPYLFFIQIINLNFLGIKNGSKFIIVASCFNILFALSQILALRIVNVSLRFVEKNNIRKKDNSIIHWILIVIIVFALHYFSLAYASLILFARALFQMHSNFSSLEILQIRRLSWFYSLISIQLVFLTLLSTYLKIHFFNSFFIVTAIVCFTVCSAYHFSCVLSFQVPRYLLRSSKYILDSETKGQNSETSDEMNFSQMNKIILQLRIMVSILIAKLQYNIRHKVQSNSTQNFDFWWHFYDRFLLEHKIYCTSVTCICKSFQKRNLQQNDKIEKQIFSDKISNLIKQLQKKCLSSHTKLRILQSCFLIETQKKPLKIYYQLIKILSCQCSREQTLEVQNLMIETRDNFQQILIKQKVENRELDLSPLFEFQSKLKNMRNELVDMAFSYRDFYEVFASNFVQMQTLKNHTRKLTKFKQTFNKEIDECLQKFDKSIQLMVFCMVYYTYFDEYSTKLDLIEKKAQKLHEHFQNTRIEIKKQVIQIFHPGYSAIKIDLVFKVGKILFVSKNLCHLLGFNLSEIEGHKINKLMPHMFSRLHDKILRSFIEKGSLKMLKFKQKVYYRNANKFIVPISMRLKVDYSSTQNLCAISFIRPTLTKSEFILMSNYGKIEEITEGLYKKLFEKAFRQDMAKIKRICVPKMLLSLNYFLKDATEMDDTIREGLLLTTEDEESLMTYYKFPDLAITNKIEKSIRSSRSTGSNSSFHNSSSFSSSELDFSQDINKNNLDLKESLKDYFNKIDHNKIIGRRVSYKIQNYVANEFKCKVLEFTSINEPLTMKELLNMITSEIMEISEHLGLDEDEYKRWANVYKNQKQKIIQESFHAKEKKQKNSTINQNQIESNTTSNPFDRLNDPSIQCDDQKQSDASSDVSTSKVTKKKEIIINAFTKRMTIDPLLEYGLTLMIALMTLILILVCIFSLQLQGNYQRLQNDNLTIMNLRINFLLRLGINEQQELYSNYEIPQPAFLQKKKVIIEAKMIDYLKKSIKWINQDISWKGYQTKMSINYSDVKYAENRSIYFFMRQFSANFAGDEQLTYYFIENYVTVANTLVGLGNNYQDFIMKQSIGSTSKIHVLVIIYVSVLLSMCILARLLFRTSSKMENQITNFLSFFKSSFTHQQATFFQQFIEYNKRSDNLNPQEIQLIINKNQSKSLGQLKKKGLNFSIAEETQTKFIRILKDEKTKVSFQAILGGISAVLLCFFVIFFSEYFFSKAHDQFDIYLKLKNSAMLVQLVPSRIIMLYFINIKKLIRNEPLIDFPDSYSGLAHDRLFELQSHTASASYHGSEMQKIISDHFTKPICELISCPENQSKALLPKHQQAFYLSYRYINSFNYLRKTIKDFPTQKNIKATVGKWLDQNNVWQTLGTTDYILDLIKKSGTEITDLFSEQIDQIGFILFSLSITQIPLLIFVMFCVKIKYVSYVSDKLESTESIYKNISWHLLSKNAYAINYFDDKLRKNK